MIQVVIGVAKRRRSTPEPNYGDIEYLVGRRSGKAYTGCWEFPGGKVETGEHPSDALVREWSEELGWDIRVSTLIFGRLFTTVDLKEFQALAYRVCDLQDASFVQAPKLAAHDRIEWMSRAEILALPDDHCTPSLKPIVSTRDMSAWETLLRARECIFLAQRIAGPTDTVADIEANALRLMKTGVLEAESLRVNSE